MVRSVLVVLFYFTLSCVTAAQVRQALTPNEVVEQNSSEFLYWCKEDLGTWKVSIEPPVGCTDISRGTWDHYPIIVNVGDDELIREVDAAVKAFNREVGFNLFELDLENVNPDIGVIVYGTHAFAAAEAKFYTDNDVQHGAVLVYNGLENMDRSDVMMHELGHLVGLRHDRDNTMSIMYPSAANRVARLEKQDIEALRAIYLQ